MESAGHRLSPGQRAQHTPNSSAHSSLPPTVSAASQGSLGWFDPREQVLGTEAVGNTHLWAPLLQHLQVSWNHSEILMPPQLLTAYLFIQTGSNFKLQTMLKSTETRFVWPPSQKFCHCHWCKQKGGNKVLLFTQAKDKLHGCLEM